MSLKVKKILMYMLLIIEDIVALVVTFSDIEVPQAAMVVMIVMILLTTVWISLAELYR